MESLLQSIYENLEDDEPRLVYADWLDELGDPHADLIRIQCRLCEIFPSCGEEFVSLCCDEERWIHAHRQQFLSKCPERLGDPARAYANRRAVHLERGFPESMHIAWDGVPEELTQLWEAYPTITDVEVSGADWHPRFIDQFTLLRSHSHRLRGLAISLHSSVMDHVIGALQHAEEWPLLKRLSVQITPPDLHRLANSKVWQQLEELEVVLDTEAGVSFIDLPPLPGLRKLTVHGMDDGLASFVDSRLFPQCEDLTLRSRLTGLEHPSIISALAHDEGWQNLRRLSLARMEAHGDSFLQLITSPIMQRMEWLDLRGNFLPHNFFPRLHQKAAQSLPMFRFLEFSPYGALPDFIRHFLMLRETAHIILGVEDANSRSSLGRTLRSEGFGDRVQPCVSRWR